MNGWAQKESTGVLFLILQSPLQQQNENLCLAYMVLRLNMAAVKLHAPVLHAMLYTRMPLRYMSPTQSSLSVSLSHMLVIVLSTPSQSSPVCVKFDNRS